jgi:hypothetical protein
MLIAFASCFRRRPSGTGKNEPLASSYPPFRGLSPRTPKRLVPGHPANRRPSSSCGPKEGNGYLIN